MVDTLPDIARKGRGAVSNESGRFEPHARIKVDDGWGTAAGDDDLPPLRTTVTDEHPKSVITRNQSPDIPFDRSLNPYRGCEHGCVYCFARPTHAYQGLSAGLDFETKLFAKPDAAKLLADELRKPGYTPATLAMGTNTDPYQPIERKRGITRAVLQVLAECNHPVAIVTKSNLVLRDLDILGAMAKKGLVSVAVSVTSLDPVLARRLEPRATTPARRLDAIAGLSGAGVPVSVMVAPVIPAINDHEIEAILEAAVGAGAGAADYILLRLPGEVRGLFAEWLDAHYPDRAKRALGRMAGHRDGKLYEAQWGKRMTGEGSDAELLARRFQLAVKRLGLDRERAAGRRLVTAEFRPPVRAGDQLSLF
jgi:DNA repair photolyase